MTKIHDIGDGVEAVGAVPASVEAMDYGNGPEHWHRNTFRLREKPIGQFDMEAARKSPFARKISELVLLLLEARDALPAITMSAAKLRGIDLTLADRIEKCLEPWKTTADDPNGI